MSYIFFLISLSIKGLYSVVPVPALLAVVVTDMAYDFVVSLSCLYSFILRA